MWHPGGLKNVQRTSFTIGNSLSILGFVFRSAEVVCELVSFCSGATLTHHSCSHFFHCCNS